MTDGEENSSKEYTSAKVQGEMIKHQTENIIGLCIYMGWILQIKKALMTLVLLIVLCF